MEAFNYVHVSCREQRSPCSWKTGKKAMVQIAVAEHCIRLHKIISIRKETEGVE